MQKKYYDYYAFVCHRSKDKPLAIAIQRKLENYSIPKKIIEENDYPSKYIRHICVDVTEFEDNNLHSNILSCLEKSDKLIVICSELSAAPVIEGTMWKEEDYIDWRRDPVNTGWIGFEILNFINMDRISANQIPFSNIDEIRKYLYDNIELLNDQAYLKNHPEINPFRNIIPVVKDGDPINRTCFHPIIKIAIDRGLLKWYVAKDWNLKTEIKARRQGERGKFIDLILAVLSPNDIEEFRRRDKIRRNLQIGFSIFFTMLLVIGIAYGIDYRMPHIANYLDYVLINELPEGIDKITNIKSSRHIDYYRITITKYNKTVKLEHVNSLGTPIEKQSISHIDSPMIAVYKCRSNWLPDICEYIDRNGIVQMTYAYTTDLKYVTFQENNFISNQVYPVSKINEYGIPDRMKIDRYELIHDENGKLIKKMYMSGVNYVYDDMGVAGERYEYDTKGRLISIHYINRDEEDIDNRGGIHGLTLEYNDLGEGVVRSYINKNYENTYSKGGYSKVKYKRERNTVTYTYTDTEGNPIINSQGYAIEKDELNKDMLPSEISYYGKDGSVAFSMEGYHKEKYKYNNKGDIIEMSFYNEKEKLIIQSGGYAIKRMEKDSNGNILKEEFLGSDNREMLLKNKACTIIRSYNKGGYLIDESYYGIGNKPIYTVEGYHGFKNEYDTKNRLISSQYYGLDDKKSYNRKGYHKIIFDYDDARGNLTKIRLYDASDNLVPYSGYWAEQKLTYNAGGQVIKLEYLDQFEKPVNIIGRYASIENKYDDIGNLIQTSYFDNEGKLSDDYYINDYNIQVGSRYFAKVIFIYDEYGNIIRTECFNTEDKPVKNYFFATKECKYDEVGHVVSEHFLDENGEIPKEYFCDIFYKYDDYGNISSKEFWGENHIPLESMTDTGKKAHRIELTGDFRGNILKSVAYDKTGSETEKVKYSYDDNGRVLTEEYFDENNKYIENSKGYSIKKCEYNSLGNETREEYYGADGKLCKVGTGFAVCVKEYDDSGSLKDTYYYDEQENPVNLIIGFSHIHEDVNEYRNTTNFEVRDKSDNLIFSYRVKYNNAQKVEERLYGPDGRLYAQPGTGVAVRKVEHDDRGNQVSEKYFSDQETPMLLFNEFFEWRAEYNDKSLETKREYYGMDGKPIMIAEGFSSVSFVYDDYGREIERDFFDDKGNKVNTGFGFSSYKVKYGDDGNIQSYNYYDKDGNECNIEGEIKKVGLNLYHGEVDMDAERSDPITGEWKSSPLAKDVLNIYRIAYTNNEGKYDLLLQPYVPLSPKYLISDYMEDIKVKYNNILLKNQLEEEYSAEIDNELYTFLSDYVNTVKEGDIDKLWDMMMMDGIQAAVNLLKNLGIIKSEDEIKNFYYNFYKDELTAFKNQLTEEYGEYTISYEVKEKIKYTKEMFDQLEKEFKKYGIINIDDIVSLKIIFTVSGNGKKDIVSNSFLYSNIVLIKTLGKWKLMTPDGFPKPSNEELRKFYGIE